MEMLGKGQSKATDPPEVSQYGQEQNHLGLKKGVLYRQARPRELEETLLQLVLPAVHREFALRGCHDEVGHLDLECMLDLMYDRFFWPHMDAQAKELVGKCCPCLAFKARQAKSPPLKNILATHPLELVHLDYLCLEPGNGLEENVLVVTDHFTWYAQAYVTRTQTAQMTATTLWDKVHCPLWVTQKDPHGSRMKFWESVGGWPLWADGDMESADQSIPSTNQWPVWKIQFHPDQYAWYFTQGKEVRVEESHWNVGSCIQLHLEFSYRVQPLLSPVWETTLSSHWCHAWFGSMHNHRAKYNQVCSENQGLHLMGSEKGWGISGQRSAMTQMKLG